MKHFRTAILVGSIIAALPVTVMAAPPDRSVDGPVTTQASKLLDSVSTEDGPGAAILVDRGGTIIFRQARGSANVELGVPLAPAKVFRIASVTKIFTAALVLKLAEEGKLSLDDTLARTLPDFPGAQSITIRQLLSHMAGLSDTSLLGDDASGVLRQDMTLTALTALIAKEPLRFTPGSSQAYANAGYILLGAVIEKATGKPWYGAMQERLFDPLKLSHTRYGAAGPIIPDRVAGYTRGSDRQLANADFISVSVPTSAGALVSNVDDLRTWMRALATGHVISPASFRAMSTPASVPEGAAMNPYGFGLYVWTIRGETVVGHTGQIDGFASFLAYIPSRGVTIVALGNDDTFDAQTAGRRLAAIMIGRPYVTETMPLSGTLMQDLAGSYDDGGRTVTLTAKDGILSYRRDGGRSFPLQMLSLALLLAAATPPEPHAVVTAMFEAFSRHDAHAIARLYAPDARLTSPDFCAARGRDDVARTYGALFAAYPDIKDKIEVTIVDGDRVAVRFVAASPSDGLTMPVQAMIGVRDGLIVEDDSVFDTGGEPCHDAVVGSCKRLQDA